MTVSCLMEVKGMAQNTQPAAIAEALSEVKLIDTHEHVADETVRLDLDLDFSYLLPHYLSSDLVSAGMSPGDLEAIRLPARKMNEAVGSLIDPRHPLYPFPERLPPEELSVEEKWRRFAPFWEKTRNTGYARCLLIAIKDLFRIEDLTEGTYLALSEALQASNKPGWYRHVLQERAGIEIAVADCGTTDLDRELFVPSMHFDRFVFIRDPIDLRRLEYDTDTAIQSLDDLVRALHLDMGQKLQGGMIAVKTGLAYQRAIHYEDVTQHEAELSFNRLFRHPQERLSFEEAKPCQDYVMHQIIRYAIDLGLPVQIHTGLQEGSGNVITNSRPTLLTNLFLRYPQARFDVFHAGYPYHSQLAALAKNFPNVYADMCWMHMISPWMAARILHEWLETIPVSKILGFGGDFHIVEGSYGHSRLARQVIALVLGEKVEAGYCTQEEAIAFGKRLLRENAREFFGL